MTQYGIGVARNRFELFDMEEEDPIEVLKRQEKEREARKKNKAAEKENKEAAAALKQKQASQHQQKQTTQQQNQRDHYPQRDQYQQQQREQRDRDFQREPRRRDGPVKDSFDSRGKRMFDRQSGSDKTGVKSVDKREGSGAHNWGNPKDDVEAALAEEPEIEQSPELPSPEETPVKEEEVPVRELTLDEWLAMKAPREKPVFNLREAGQGEDLSRWKKMYALNKKKNDDGEEEDEYEIIDCPQRVGRLKRLDIDVKFKDSGRRGGGRGGGRGGFNSRRTLPQHQEDNNNVREEKQQKPAPRVDDEQDFPSLG